MIRASLIREIEHEGTQTKRILERVPFEKFDWKPHEKSMSLGRLAVHIAEIPRWTSRILSSTDFDIASVNYQPTPLTSTEELVQLSDEKIQKAVVDLQAAKDEDMMVIWTLRRGDQTRFALPRAAVIRAMAMNHLVHHRGQLSVYLRLLNVPVPGIYGPSADES